jgi:peptidoglycan hydrolase-like protein with peptidoglycan-binding domain
VKKFIVATMVVITAFGVTARSTVAFAAATPIGQLNMDAVPKIDQDGIRKVQTLLKDKGFDPGPIDGVDGARTTSALRGFQERFGIKFSGVIDNQTLFALGAIDLAGPAE